MGYDMGMIRLKLRSGSGTTAAHGRNVTRYISQCGEVDEGGRGAGQWCPMRYKKIWTLGRAAKQARTWHQGTNALAVLVLDSGLLEQALILEVGRWCG